MQLLKPIRVKRTYVQKVNARPEQVFPLLCPVRETEWVEGWDPKVVLSNSGLAEEDCVFVTGDSEEESVWVITDHDLENLTLRMIRVTPGMTVGKILIVLKESVEGGTDAHVTYMYTALSAEGINFVESYTEGFFTEFMRYWEEALNSYLSRSGS